MNARKPTVLDALRFLAGRCDFALALDGTGFNAHDAQFGHELSEQDFLSPKQKAAAWRMIQKYRKQLMKGGIDIDQIPRPTESNSNDSGRKGERRAEKPKGVEAPDAGRWITAKYDGDCSKCGERTRAGDRIFYADGSVWHESCVKKSEKPSRIVVHGDKLRIEFEYAPSVVTAVKEIPGRKFHPKDKAWDVRPTLGNVSQIVQFAEQWSFQMADEARELLDGLVAKADGLSEASRAADAEFEVERLGGELMPFQKAGVKYAVDTERVLIADEMGLGKAQPLDAKLLTPDGWLWMADVQVGRQVIGSNGCPTKVTGVYLQGVRQVFRVTFSDGATTRCCGEHLWSVTSPLRKWRGLSPRVISLEEIKERGLTHRNGNHQHFIPMVSPMEFQRSWQLRVLPPYVMGALLGDGSFRAEPTIKFSTEDDEILERVVSLLGGEWKSRHLGNYDYAITRGAGANQKGAHVHRAIRMLGLWGKYSNEKAVPYQYLFAPTVDRLELLRGLMDTDGWVNKGKRGNAAQFCSASHRLAKNVQFLCWSLGGTAKIKKKQNAWTVTLGLPSGVCPFWLKRKAEIYPNDRTKYEPTRSVVNIEPDGKEVVQCISVEAPDGLYVTDDFVVTHNTVQALAVLRHENAFPAVVVCPSVVKTSWARHVKEWLPGCSVNILEGTRPNAQGNSLWADVTILNYDILPAWVQELRAAGPIKAVIFDESHYVKNHKAKRTEAAKALVKGVRVRLLLTGTPVLNRPQELLSQLGVMGRLDDLGGFWEFAKRYCQAQKTQWGWDMSGAANLEELNERLRSTCFVRRRKSEVLAELPDKRRATVTVELDNRKEYDAAEADVVGWIGLCAARDEEFLESIKLFSEEDKKRAIRAQRATAEARAEQAEQLVRIEALKQLAVKGKMEAVKEWLKNFLETGEKLVLFAHHREVVKTLAAEFDCPSIIGDDDAESRQEAIDRFQDDPDTPLIVLSMKAGGIGITLTAASNVAFIELGWTPADHDQAEDRCHRIGQKNSVTAWYLTAERTIDEEIETLLNKKRSVVTAATEGGEAEQTSILKDLVAWLSNRR